MNRTAKNAPLIKALVTEKIMPKRTNIFQHLVKLLHDRLDDKYVVNESIMLLHKLTRKKREVDIVLKYKLGMYNVIVSI